MTEKTKSLDSGSLGFNERVKMEYEELSKGYHAIRDIRFKLIGFLPLASSGLFLVFTKQADEMRWSFLLPIGLFGMAVTVGLYLYEQVNLAQSKKLIERGRDLEKEAEFAYGPFTIRAELLKKTVGAGVPAGFVFGATIAAWAYVAWVGFVHAYPSVCLELRQLVKRHSYMTSASLSIIVQLLIVAGSYKLGQIKQPKAPNESSVTTSSEATQSEPENLLQ